VIDRQMSLYNELIFSAVWLFTSLQAFLVSSEIEGELLVK